MKTLLKSIAALLVALAVAIPVSLLAQVDAEAIASRLPEKIAPLTREQLNTKVPHFYCFEYRGEPQPGKRYWLRLNDTTWIERYPDGLESTFRVLGHTSANGAEGTVVVKVSGDEEQTGTDNEGGLQAFIPDKGSKVMHHWYRNARRGDEQWNDLGEMLSVE